MPKPVEPAAPPAQAPKAAEPAKLDPETRATLAGLALSGLVSHDQGHAKVGSAPGRASLAAEAVALADALAAELAK